MTDDDEERSRGGGGGGDLWSLPPERGAAAVVEDIEASGKSFAARTPKGRSGFDTAITGEAENEDDGHVRLPARIGDCRIDAHLGTGGMAEVFSGYRPGPGGEERVVVKRMLSHLCAEKSFVDMFLREADVASKLHHPNVVGYFGQGRDDGSYFLILEHVDGLTLQKLARRAWRGRVSMPLELVARAIADAALGLAHAHEARGPGGEELKLVHRDVSPDNLIVDRAGTTKVLDFGIAKGSTTIDVTRTGEIKGKIPFMSPEQLQGGVVDHRADLYSLGVTLYWLLTGTRPFRGDSDIRLMQAILMEHPAPPSALNPAVPAAADELVVSLLAKDPSHRPASGREIHDALLPFAAASKAALSSFVIRMMDAPPPPSTGSDVSGPFRAASPTTDRQSTTFSARVAELASHAASPAFVDAPAPARRDDVDEAALKAAIVGPSPLLYAALAVALIGTGALALWFVFLRG